MLSLKKGIARTPVLRRAFASSSAVRQVQEPKSGPGLDAKYHIIDHEYDCVVVGAVSYTHLDVYKRQPLYTVVEDAINYKIGKARFKTVIEINGS